MEGDEWKQEKFDEQEKNRDEPKKIILDEYIVKELIN